MTTLDEQVLGISNELLDFDSRSQNRDVACALAAQANNTIRIFTQDLEIPVYDDRHFIQSLTRLATLSRRSKIQVLVKDSGNAIRTGHRIIELARRFSSSIFIQNPSKDLEEYNSAFMLVDDSGYLFKNHGGFYKGYFNFNDKLKVKELAKFFQEAWDYSHPDPEFRRLHI